MSAAASFTDRFHNRYGVNPHPPDICCGRSRGPLKLLDEQRLESQTLQLPALPASLGVHSITMPLVPLTRFRTINYVMGNIIRKLSSKPADILKASTKGKIHQTRVLK